MKAVLAILALAALLGATAAQGFDRKPIRLQGLTPDGWGYTNSGSRTREWYWV